MKSAAGRCCDRPRRQTAVLCYELVERRDSVWAAVSVGVDHHEAWASERNAGHGFGVDTPPSTHTLRVSAHGLPARDERAFLPSAVLPIDADRKYRNAGFGPVKCGREVSRLHGGPGCSARREERLLRHPLGGGRRWGRRPLLGDGSNP